MSSAQNSEFCVLVCAVLCCVCMCVHVRVCVCVCVHVRFTVWADLWNTNENKKSFKQQKQMN